jgi:hypothetical protein
MSTLAIPRPASDEAAPFYHGHFAEVRGENIGAACSTSATSSTRVCPTCSSEPAVR